MTNEQGLGDRNLGLASAPTYKLPGLAMAAINVAIVFHLMALGALALSPSNGPWYVPYFAQPNTPSAGPQFAAAIAEVTTPYYLRPLGLANNYHFESNRTDLPTICVEEIVPGDAKGKKEKLPDPGSNMWVRYRQRLLVNSLGMDSMFMPRQGQIITQGQPQKIAFFFNPYDAVMQKLISLKEPNKFATKKWFLDELAKVLNKDELDRYQEDVLSLVENERFQAAQTFKDFDRSIKADDAKALNDWLDKQHALPPPGVPPSVFKIPYIITDKLLQSVRPQEPDQKMFFLYETDEHNMPKVQVWTAAPFSLVVARSIHRYAERHGSEVELVRMNRAPLAPLLMFPNPEAGKLLIDAPPPNYSLDIVYHNLGKGEPKPWKPN